MKPQAVDFAALAGLFRSSRALQWALAWRVAVWVGGIGLGFYVYYAAVARMGGDFWPFVLSLAVPLSAVLGAWLWAYQRAAAQDLSALQDWIAEKPPQAGQWAAVHGKAVAVGEVGVSGLRRQPALASRHQVLGKVRRVRRGQSSGSGGGSGIPSLRYLGFHLVPTAIDGRAGAVRLMGFPDLSHLSDGMPGRGSAFEVEARAQPYSKFIPRFVGPVSVTSMACEQIAIDWLFDQDRDSEPLKIKEWVLPPDTEVCAFGIWRDGGLYPQPTRPDGLPLYPGAPAAVLSELQATHTLVRRAAVVLLLFAIGSLAYLHW